ncbi:MAG TPA: LCP family protein [Anaerolineaceae bacterium]|nr:LCP family protein [Anaerolineaceae bacterium]
MLPKFIKPFVFAVLILALTACNMPIGEANVPVTVSGAVSYLLVTPNPDATQTPTPFQPVTSTPRPTNEPTLTPTQENTPTNTPTSVPTNLPLSNAPGVWGKYPDGQVRIMVLGSDQRPGGGYRTDIIMMVSINPHSGTVSVLSFPRDLYVDIPGWGMNRINTAMEFGGFPLLASTLQSNFGISPNRYILTTFNGFTSIIDSLGGVDVNASTTLTDKCKFKASYNVNGWCTIRPGIKRMNGALALWYVRSRHSTSDFDRERRSQEVLQALFQKLFSLDAVSHIPDLYTAYRKNVDTNLTVDDIINLAPVAVSLAADKSRIRRFTIGPGQVSDFTTDAGAMVLVPNVAAIQGIIQQAVFKP